MTFSDSFFRWRPHPWHGPDVGPAPPALVHGFGLEVLIDRVYGRDHALEVIQASMDDYMEEYGS